MAKNDVELDNRDISTTRVWVEVDVFELFVNALENAGMSNEQFEAVVDFLDNEHRLMVEHPESYNNPFLTAGIEFLMQGLKQSGYEFS